MRRIFSEVPNKGAALPVHHDQPFEGKGGVLHRVVSVKDENILYISWPIPNQRKSIYPHVNTQLDYRKKADEYITHLLGYEGKHSLTSFLNDEGLVTSLSASCTEFNEASQSIELEICLTEEGYDNW